MKLTITLGERAILDSRGHIIVATDEIVYVLAVVGRSDGVIAGFEAELVTPNESVTRAINIPLCQGAGYVRVPVVYLSEGLPIRVSGSVGENDAAKRIALQISTVRVKFTTLVCGVESYACVTDESDDLDVR